MQILRHNIKKQGLKRPLICIKCNKRGTFKKRKREREREKESQREREREKERGRKRERERDSFGILYTGYV